jgi:hypothetical protein
MPRAWHSCRNFRSFRRPCRYKGLEPGKPEFLYQRLGGAPPVPRRPAIFQVGGAGYEECEPRALLPGGGRGSAEERGGVRPQSWPRFIFRRGGCPHRQYAYGYQGEQRGGPGGESSQAISSWVKSNCTAVTAITVAGGTLYHVSSMSSETRIRQPAARAAALHTAPQHLLIPATRA